MDANWIYGRDTEHLPPTRAPYVAWTGHPRPRPEDCGNDDCRAAREHAWAVADAAYERENAARRWADDVEWENAQLRRQVAQLMRSIEGAA